MVDSHVTIGSCAQVGKHIHISASTQIGGVLEPAGAMPTIIEDGAFIGGNCGIYEGTIVQEGAVVASGVPAPSPSSAAASPSRAACTSTAPSSSNTATKRPPAASSSKTCSGSVILSEAKESQKCF